MKRQSTIIIIAALLSIYYQLANASSLQVLKQDADALCQVYNPSKWTKFSQSHTPLEIYPELGRRIRKAIKTPEFHSIFQKYLHVRNQNYYQFINAQVSQLIGKHWDCKYLNQFKLPKSIKVLSIRSDGIKILSPAHDSTNTILVTIDKNGNYFINNKPLINNEEDTLRQAIRITAGKTKNITILIQADSSAPTASLISLLYVSNSLHIKYVDFEVQ